MGPVWKRNPPCTAHKILNKMFEENKVSPDTTAASVYKLHPEFLKFSSHLFRGAFNEIRMAHGTGCTYFNKLHDLIVFLIFSRIPNILVKRLNSEVAVDQENRAGCSGTNPGSFSDGPKTIENGHPFAGSDAGDLDPKIVHYNQPVLMTVYTDPITEKEKVCVIASLPGGATDVEFSVVGSGPGTSTARITYSWPKTAFSIDEIFAKSIKEGTLTPCHPMILELKKELQNNRASVDAVPRGAMELTLPIPVQTDSDTISHSGGKKEDGTMLLIVQLLAFQNAYTVKNIDRKVKFEDF